MIQKFPKFKRGDKVKTPEGDSGVILEIQLTSGNVLYQVKLPGRDAPKNYRIHYYVEYELSLEESI